MNKFFYYYNSLCIGANTPSSFSYDPYVTAIKDVLVSELQQVVYYIEKLKNLDIDMSEYTDKVIDFISVLIVNLDFNKESFFVIVEDLNKNKNLLEQLYISACDKRSKTPELLNSTGSDYSTKENILKALNDREKNLKNNELNVEIPKDKKNLYEIMINLVLNSCNCLIELKTFGVNFQKAKDKVLKLLNSTNFPKHSVDELINIIKGFSKCNYEIMKLLYETIGAKYGPVIKNEVPRNILKGKSILVSGTSFKDLEKILRAVKGLNINVYVHHEMISAFQYQKFLEFENLVGFYQKSNNNFPLDFASFSGPIYISRNSIPKIDVIRGQIYTSAKYPSFGISKIENDDFSPLIKYALDSEGFLKEEKLQSIQIGYSEKDIENCVDLICNNLNKGLVKHIFIIGLIDQFSQNSSYVKDFIEKCPKDCALISFSNVQSTDNVLYVNSFFDFSILYKIVEQIIENVPNYQDKLSVILADCNSSTLSHIFNLIHLKVKNIFLGPCCPNIINPSLIDGMQDLFNVKSLSSPIEDIEKVI